MVQPKEQVDVEVFEQVDVVEVQAVIKQNEDVI